MNNPDRDADDCKTKQDYANVSFHLHADRVETKNMRTYKWIVMRLC